MSGSVIRSINWYSSSLPAWFCTGGGGASVSFGGSNSTITSGAGGIHNHTGKVGSAEPDPVSIIPPVGGVTVYIKL